jgi:hypothetical protein
MDGDDSGSVITPFGLVVTFLGIVTLCVFVGVYVIGPAIRWVHP